MKIDSTFRSFSFAVLFIFFIVITSTHVVSAQILSYTTATSGALNSVAANAFGDSLTRIGCVATTSSCTTGFTSNTFSDSSTYAPTRTAVQTWVAPDSGYTLNVDSFSANMRRSGTGPDSAMYAYSADGGNTWIAEGTDFAIPDVACAAGTTFAWPATVTVGYPDTLRFRIYSFHATGTSGTEQILNLTISGTVTANNNGSCGVPSNLAASDVTDSTASLNWSAVLGASSYNIQYRISGAGSWNTDTSESNSINISGLSSGQTYQFEVRAVCSDTLTGNFSNQATFITSSSGGGGSGSCDTIINIASTDSILLYPYGSGQTGYISGNNSYGDLAKAEEFTSVVGRQVTGSLMFFAHATVLSTDSAKNIAINVWDASGPGGHPGNILATDSITFRTIANAVTTHSLLYIPFANLPALTDTNFFIGVMLPTTVGDTIALYTNLKTSSDGRGWELWKNNVWHPYDSAYTTLPDSFGNYIEAITCPAAPESCGIPANLSASDITDSSATLNWGAIAGATGYHIQYRISGSNSWYVDTTTVDSIHVSSLSGGQTYQFEVQTVCSDTVNSSFSNTFSFITLTTPGGCGVATNLTTSNITDSTATLYWDSVAGATSYHIEYRISGTNSWSTDTTSADSVNITGLSSGQTYQFQVQTICSDSINGNYSGVVNFNTLPAPGSCNAPINLSTSDITDSSATLKWGAVVGAIGYNIQYHKLGTSGWGTGTSVTDSTIISGLAAGQTYIFEVQTICTGGATGIFSDSTVFTTFPASNNSGSCDTIINIATTDSILLYPYGGGHAGYIAGNNSYGDLAKAEEFTSVVGNQITEALMLFAHATVLSTDSATTVAVNVWDDTGPGGHPGNILATNSITLGSIADAVTTHSIIYIPFASPPVLTDTNFFIGVMLPTTVGDTIALYTNLKTSTDGRGWELWKNGVWHPYDSAYTTLPDHFGNYIEAVSCPPAPVMPPVAAFSAQPDSGCASLTVNFTDQSTNTPASWSWTFTGGLPTTSTLQNPSVVYAAAGTYTVTLTASNTGGSNTITDTNLITVYPSPTITAIQTFPATGQNIADGYAIAAVTGGSQPYHYAWNNLETGDTDLNMAAGTYTLTVTDHNDCSTVDSAVITYTVGIDGVNSIELLKIYPNPANDILHVEWSGKTEIEIAIVDLAGKEVRSFSANASVNLDIHDLASGPYIIYIKDKQTQTQQAIKFSKL